jgi:predicted ATPase
VFIRSIRLLNYRSFVDSGTIILARDRTILAGQNASGKSAIIEALCGLSLTAWGYPSSAKPIGSDDEPELHVVYSFVEGELDFLQALYKSAFSESQLASFSETGLSIEFTTGTNTWRNVQIPGIPDDYQVERAASFDKLEEELKSAGVDISAKIGFDRKHYNTAQTRKLKDTIARNQAANPSQERLGALTRAANILSDIERKFPIQQFREALASIEPIPVRVGGVKMPEDLGTSVKGLSKDDAFQALSRAYKFDYSKYKAANPQSRRQQLAKVSSALQQDVTTHWSQWPLDFRVAMDVDRVLYGLVEGDKWFAGNQVSDGTRSFLEMLLELRGLTGDSRLILFDEPGAFLHISAQKDLIELINDVCADYQVVYTTHSPYMIPIDGLRNVRLVERGDAGSIIHNSAYDGGESEGWQPLMDAIGFDISHGSAQVKPSNVVFEGISDYIYVCAMATILDEDIENLGLIPCFGGTNVRNVASLLHGWRLRYCVIFDTDGAGKRDREALLDEPLFPSHRVLKISDIDGQSIEDLFSVHDFDRYIAVELASKRVEGESNSKLMSRFSRPSKALVAKVFAENVAAGSVTLDEISTKSFRTLFAELRDAFNDVS